MLICHKTFYLLDGHIALSSNFMLICATAEWQSGDAEDCKSLYAGSIPALASFNQKVKLLFSDRFDVTLKS